MHHEDQESVVTATAAISQDILLKGETYESKLPPQPTQQQMLVVL